MLVKDNNNLLNFNQWSCGEYNNNLNDFTLNTTQQQKNIISNDYSKIGENSLKMISSQTADYIRIWYLTELKNKKITCKLHIKTEETIDILLREYDSNNTIISIKYTTFTGCGDVSLILNSSNTSNNKFLLQISNVPKDKIVYVDDIILTTS